MIKNVLAAVVSCMILAGIISPVMAHGPDEPYQVIFQINENDKAKMNLLLNNVSNVVKHFNEVGQEVKIEVIAYGPGLNMLRDDTSPVKKRVESFSQNYENVHFAACGNTIKKMTKKEGKKPALMNTGTIAVVPSGVIQILKRQDEGWHYIRP